MSNHRENALAFGLSRALALIDRLKPGSSMSPAAQAWPEVEAFKEEMGKLLSTRHTLRNPADHIPGLTDAAFVGSGAGWLIQFSTNPMQDAAQCAGKVNVYKTRTHDNAFKQEVREAVGPTHTTVFFKLAPDPMSVTQNTEGQKVADIVALFARTVLDAKGMDDWDIETVIINDSQDFQREAYIPAIART